MLTELTQMGNKCKHGFKSATMGFGNKATTNVNGGRVWYRFVVDPDLNRVCNWTHVRLQQIPQDLEVIQDLHSTLYIGNNSKEN